MKEFFEKYQKQIIIGFIILAIVVTIIIIYSKGKSDGKKIKPEDYKFINPGTGEEVVFNPGLLTDALYKDMKPHSFWSFQGWSGRNLSPYKELVGLQDNGFIAVAKDWAKRYAALEGGKSLFEKLIQEVDYAFTYSGPSFATLRDQIITRAIALNIY